MNSTKNYNLPKKRLFSTTHVKEMDGGFTLVTTAISNASSPFLDPLVGNVMFGVTWLTVIVGTIFNIATEHEFTSPEILTEFFIISEDEEVISMDAHVLRELINMLEQGAVSLQNSVPGVLSTTNAEALNHLYEAIRALHFLIDGLSIPGETEAHIVVRNGAFDAVANFSRRFEEIAEGDSDLESLAGEIEDEIWPALRTAGNTVLEVMRSMEWEMDMDPRGTTDVHWTE